MECHNFHKHGQTTLPYYLIAVHCLFLVLKMPQATVKLIWSVAACNFCPRSDVRTCQIKPGKLLSKLSSALDLDESLLNHSEGICTCCLADIDMIIRSIAIRGAMKDYFMDMVQNMQRGYNSFEKNQYFNGHDRKSLTSPMEERVDDQMSYAASSHVAVETKTAPLPPTLVARPPFPSDSSIPDQPDTTIEIPTTSPTSTAATINNKKFVPFD